MSPTSISNALNLKSTEISLRSFYEETLNRISPNSYRTCLSFGGKGVLVYYGN